MPSKLQFYTQMADHTARQGAISRPPVIDFYQISELILRINLDITDTTFKLKTDVEGFISDTL